MLSLRELLFTFALTFISTVATVIGVVIAHREISKKGRLVVSASPTFSDKDANQSILVTSTNHGDKPVWIDSVNIEFGPSNLAAILFPFATQHLEVGMQGENDNFPHRLEHGQNHQFVLPISEDSFDREFWRLTKISATDTLGKEYKLSRPSLYVLKKHLKLARPVQTEE